MSQNLFELAVRKKYRFTSPAGVNPQGQLTVEQVLDLSIDALDALAVTLDDQLEKKSKSFKSNKRSVAQQDIQNKLELVKSILQEKEELAATRKEAQEIRAKETELESLIASKQASALAELPLDVLQKQLQELQAQRLELAK